AFRPVGPYPVLIIHGHQGSAKSTLLTVIRELIDPQTAAHLAEPRSTGDLMVTALNGWMLAFDNLSTLPNWLSDSLCRLATGGGFATRAIYSNDERNVIFAERPIVLSGIDEFVRRGDLADRGVVLHLPLLPQSKRREREELWGEFRELQPRILGGLLHAAAGGLRELRSVRPTGLPRMADFARFGEAVGRGLGWPPDAFLTLYMQNRQEATLSTLEDSILASLLLKNLKLIGAGLVNLTGTASDLHRKLTLELDRRTAASASWPKTPALFARELRRLAPILAENGLFVIYKRNMKARMSAITTRPERHETMATNQEAEASA